MIITVTPNPVLDRTILVQSLAFDEVLRADDVHLDWGGKGFNVSRALLSAGTQSIVMGFLGGATGQMLARGLHALGLETDFVSIDGETRTNIVIAEPTGRHVKVNEAGPSVSASAQDELAGKLRTRLCDGDICVLAGSLPPGVDNGFYARLIDLAREQGAFTILDASGDALLAGLESHPDLIKPNELEAAQIAGHPIRSVAEAASFVRSVSTRGIRYATVSLGADGLVAAQGKRCVHASPPAIQEINNVGAGDATVAGMTWAIERGAGIHEVARRGVTFGTTAALLQGVQFGNEARLNALASEVVCVDL